MTQLRYLSARDIIKLEVTIDSRRDRLLLQTIYETGCTVNEAVLIKIQDIDLRLNLINFPAENTKAKSAKTARISQELATQFYEHLKEKKDGSQDIFSSRQSASMTTKRARQLIQSYGTKAGLGKVLPQMIRYAHVAHAVEKGIPLDAIEQQTGLDKIRLAQICKSISEPLPQDPYRRFFEREEKR